MCHSTGWENWKCSVIHDADGGLVKTLTLCGGQECGGQLALLSLHVAEDKPAREARQHGRPNVVHTLLKTHVIRVLQHRQSETCKTNINQQNIFLKILKKIYACVNDAKLWYIYLNWLKSAYETKLKCTYQGVSVRRGYQFSYNV